MSTSSETTTIHSITGLRWIAAFLVILRHNPIPSDSSWYPIFFNGHSGVTVFFVLSGFVLALNYFTSFEVVESRSIGDFYIARIARIYPLYVVVLIGYGIAFKFDSPLVVGQHILLLQAWNSNSDVAYGMNGPGWSLGVEAFFYAIFPFIVSILHPILRKPWRALVVLGCSLIFIAVVSSIFQFSDLKDLAENDPNSYWRWIYRNPAFRLGDFLAGVCLAQIFVSVRTGVHRVTFRALGLFSWIGLVLALASRRLVNNAFGVDFVFAVLACGIIMSLAVDREGAVSRLLGSMPLRKLGEFSFAAYLVHVPIKQGLFKDILGAGITSASTARFVSYLLVVITVSALLHYVIERPARSAIRKLAFRRS